MRVFLVIFLLLSFQFAFSQSYIPAITQYTTKDGLSSDKVYALHKDTRGFIWIGTEDGLNRFDGTSFKVYSQANRSDMTISTIHEVFEDDQGYLWLLKKNEIYEQGYQSPEINLFHLDTEEIMTPKKKFGTSMPFDVKDIHFMKMLEDGQLYFYCERLRKGFVYSTSSGFKPLTIPQEIFRIGDMILQEDGNFLIKGKNISRLADWKLYKVDQEGNILNQKEPNLIIPFQKEESFINAKFDGENYLIKGFNLDAYNHFAPNLTFEKGTQNDWIQINQSSWNKTQKLLWIFNREQIIVSNSEGNIVFEKKEKFDGQQHPVLFDGHTTWISNKIEGLMAIDLRPNYFTNYRFFEQDLDNSTRGIYQDKHGKVWVSTINGTAQIFSDGQILVEETVANVFTRYMEDTQGNLWYFQNNGLVRLDVDTQKKTFFSMNGGFESWSLLEKNTNEIWFSGHNGSIFKINTQSGNIRLRALLPSNINLEFHVYDYLQKDDASYWLCTSQGLYLMASDGLTLEVYNKDQDGKNYLPIKAVHHIYQDKDGTIWLATSDAGLLKLKFEKGAFKIEKQFTIDNGLSCNAIHSIYEDDFDYLWISSDNGLMQFDKQSEKVYHYFKEDGIPHNEFNRIAHYRGKDGQLFFGGLLGVTTFHPKDFSSARNLKNKAALVISNFQQFSDKAEKFLDLTNQLLQESTITLQPNDQLFNLKVALLDFSNEQQHSYQYQINNNGNWESNSTGEFKISGLPYGRHTMEIKAFDRQLKEAENNLMLHIQVLKPFYLKWWFIILSLCIFGVSSWLILRKRYLIFENKKSTITLQNIEQEKVVERLERETILETQEEIPPNSAPMNQDDLDWLQKVKQIAIREIKNPGYNIDHLSKELFISTRHLNRRVKSISGMTPKKYLISIRLQKARDILEQENPRTLTEVCYAIGFENTTHFANLFEAEFGNRPHKLLKKSLS